jgi:hypothetical protein
MARPSTRPPTSVVSFRLTPDEWQRFEGVYKRLEGMSPVPVSVAAAVKVVFLEGLALLEAPRKKEPRKR